MGLFDGVAKKEAVEQQIMQQIASYPIIKKLVHEINLIGKEKEQWLLTCQGYYDSCVRNVIIEPDSLTVTWTSARTLKISENGSDTKEENEEGNFGSVCWHFTDKGYVPLHKHYNEKGKVDVSLAKVCYLFATLVREQMMVELPEACFCNNIYQDANYRASFTYEVPRGSWQEWF